MFFSRHIMYAIYTCLLFFLDVAMMLPRERFGILWESHVAVFPLELWHGPCSYPWQIPDRVQPLGQALGFFPCIFSFFVWEMSGLSIYKLYIFGWTEDYLMIRIVACHTIGFPYKWLLSGRQKTISLPHSLWMVAIGIPIYVLNSRPICPDSHPFFPGLQPLWNGYQYPKHVRWPNYSQNCKSTIIVLAYFHIALGCYLVAHGS